MYLEIKGTDIDAIADSLDDIKESIRNGTTFGDAEYYGTIVAWKLNTFQR
jgi:hypothetical protein